MENRVYTVAILGVGARGGNAYGKLIMKKPDKFKIVALCDPREDRLSHFGEMFGVPATERFTSEDEFFLKKRADILLITTLDTLHVRQCIRAFKTGYDVLLEKPITDKLEECRELLDVQKKHGNRALVCHVLRYAPAYVKLSEILDSGRLGRLISMNWTEPVGYWHQAHSYVRGSWRNTDISAPMILAKSCHDLDLIQFYAKSRCRSVSSVGSLAFFNEANAPENTADRCTDCRLVDSCPYSAKRIYIERWHGAGEPADSWPYNVPVMAPVTEEKLYEAIRVGDYGRCVFRCDNNVVDNQLVQMQFENCVTATLTMNAFNIGGGRKVSFYCSLGEIYMDEKEIAVRPFGAPEEHIDLSEIEDIDYAHGGGDAKLIDSLYGMMSGDLRMVTTLEESVESHLMGIAAERSRINGGSLEYIHS